MKGRSVLEGRLYPLGQSLRLSDWVLHGLVHSETATGVASVGLKVVVTLLSRVERSLGLLGLGDVTPLRTSQNPRSRQSLRPPIFFFRLRERDF